MPLLLDALAFLGPLLKKRDAYYLAVILAMGILWGLAVRRDHAKGVLLATRATVDAHTDQKTSDHEERGAVVIVRKFAPAPPSACGAPPSLPVLVEERVEKAPVIIDRSREAVADRHEAPACPAAARPPWRYMGILVDPLQTPRIVGAHVGVTVGGVWDLGVGFRTSPRLEGQAEAGVRF